MVNKVFTFFLFTFLLASSVLYAQDQGKLIVAPLVMRAGSLQEINYTYTVGKNGIKPGGGIRIEIPIAYSETEFLYWTKPQANQSGDLGYTIAKTSNNADLKLVDHGLVGGIMDVLLIDKGLSANDKITIKYKGKVQSIAGKVEIRVAIKQSEKDEWHKQNLNYSFKILPSDAATILIHYPSDIRLNDYFDATFVAIDKFGNPATGYTGTLQLQSNGNAAQLPASIQFTKTDSGIHVVKGVQFTKKGFQKISATDQTKAVKTSNHYAWVDDKVNTYKHLFGDTHFHTGTGNNHFGLFASDDGGNVNTLSTEKFKELNEGGDHRGNYTNAIDAYRYATDIVKLDFGSCSEHDSKHLNDTVWQKSQDITDAFYKPGKFTTFYAYEWTPALSHHIIMYKSKQSKVFDYRKYPDLPALWKALDKQGDPAITIPHMSWTFDNHDVWNDINETYHKIGEIYSLWNSRFLVQPDDMPQRFELGAENKWSYQYGWAKGNHIGVVGSTDNHLGQPGANNYTIYTQHSGGLAVVLSRENNRDSLWDAFQQRRTYATTGTRIYLDFTADDHDMGTEYTTKSLPQFKGKIAGTNTLASVELVKMQDGAFVTVYSIKPNTETVEFSFTDNQFTKSAMYYLRVKQVDEYKGRLYSHSTAEMAWSSPIWINKE
ncbi:MAG: DUF3604 domain-containing protein [Sphingobacteriia bacterium]|jgi:hypothetical protein